MSCTFSPATDHTDHAFARTQHPERVRPDKHRAIRFGGRRDFHRVPDRDSIGNQHGEFDAGFNRRNGGVFHPGRGHKKNRDVDLAQSFDRVLRRVEHGDAKNSLPTFSGRRARDNIGSVLAH